MPIASRSNTSNNCPTFIIISSASSVVKGVRIVGLPNPERVGNQFGRDPGRGTGRNSRRVRGSVRPFLGLGRVFRVEGTLLVHIFTMGRPPLPSWCRNVRNDNCKKIVNVKGTKDTARSPIEGVGSDFSLLQRAGRTIMRCSDCGYPHARTPNHYRFYPHNTTLATPTGWPGQYQSDARPARVPSPPSDAFHDLSLNYASSPTLPRPGTNDCNRHAFPRNDPKPSPATKPGARGATRPRDKFDWPPNTKSCPRPRPTTLRTYGRRSSNAAWTKPSSLMRMGRSWTVGRGYDLRRTWHILPKASSQVWIGGREVRVGIDAELFPSPNGPQAKKGTDLHLSPCRFPNQR